MAPPTRRCREAFPKRPSRWSRPCRFSQRAVRPAARKKLRPEKARARRRSARHRQRSRLQKSPPSRSPFQKSLPGKPARRRPRPERPSDEQGGAAVPEYQRDAVLPFGPPNRGGGARRANFGYGGVSRYEPAATVTAAG